MGNDTQDTMPIMVDSADCILPGGPVSLDSEAMGIVELDSLDGDDERETLEMCRFHAEMARIKMESLAKVIMAKASIGADCTTEALEIARMVL